jgi:hypothetical protein
LVAEHFDLGNLRETWLEHQRHQHNHSHLFWALLNLSLWERQFLAPGGINPPTAATAQT